MFWRERGWKFPPRGGLAAAEAMGWGGEVAKKKAIRRNDLLLLLPLRVCCVKPNVRLACEDAAMNCGREHWRDERNVRGKRSGLFSFDVRH